MKRRKREDRLKEREDRLRQPLLDITVEAKSLTPQLPREKGERAITEVKNLPLI